MNNEALQPTLYNIETALFESAAITPEASLPTGAFQDVDSFAHIRADRRAVYEETGYLPPAVGGAPDKQEDSNLSDKERIKQEDDAFYEKVMSRLQGEESEEPLAIDWDKALRKTPDTWQPGTVDTTLRVFETKGVDFDKDLSADARWLFEAALLGETERDLLAQYAEMDGFDLEKAVRELDTHGFIDTSKPDFYEIKYRIIPRKK